MVSTPEPSPALRRLSGETEAAWVARINAQVEAKRRATFEAKAWPDDGPYDTALGKPCAAGALFMAVVIGALICIPLWILGAWALEVIL